MVKGSNHHARVVAKAPAPITSIVTLIGRSAAASSIRFRSSGESGAVPRSTGGPDLGLRGSVTLIRRGYKAYLSSDLERERLGRATFVYGEAQAPVGVGNEHQFASLGRTESLDVSNRHPAVTGVYFQGVTITKPRLLLEDGEPGVAEAIDGDDAGNKTRSLFYPYARRSETHQRRRVHGFPHLRKPNPGRKMCRHRGEDIAAVKGAGDGMQVKAFLGGRTSSRDATQRLRRRNEQPVVRTDHQSPALRP